MLMVLLVLNTSLFRVLELSELWCSLKNRAASRTLPSLPMQMSSGLAGSHRVSRLSALDSLLCKGHAKLMKSKNKCLQWSRTEDHSRSMAKCSDI